MKAKVINLNDYRDKKEPETFSLEKYDEEFGNRLARIKKSLEVINQLLNPEDDHDGK